MNRMGFPLITDEESRLPFLVKSVGGCDHQEHIIRPSGYTAYHWLHCVEGKGELLINQRSFTISEDMGFFFYPGVSHEYYALEKPWSTRWVTFDGYAVSALIDHIGLGKWGVYQISNIQLLENILNDILILTFNDGYKNGFERSALLYRFLLELKYCINSGDVQNKSEKHKKLQPVISFMEENFTSTPTLEEMAALIQVTPQHLCRMFRQALNMRPFVYLNKVRLQKAKELLTKSSSLTTKEISIAVGFSDPSYFCAIFKEYEGITPLEFKKMHLKP